MIIIISETLLHNIKCHIKKHIDILWLVPGKWLLVTPHFPAVTCISGSADCRPLQFEAAEVYLARACTLPVLQPLVHNDRTSSTPHEFVLDKTKLCNKTKQNTLNISPNCTNVGCIGVCMHYMCYYMNPN